MRLRQRTLLVHIKFKNGSETEKVRMGIHIKKTRQNGRKMTSFRGATAARPSWELAWIGSAPVQISECGLDGALS